MIVGIIESKVAPKLLAQGIRIFKDGGKWVFEKAGARLVGDEAKAAERAAARELYSVITKAESPIWGGLKSYRGAIKTNGLNGKERRFFRWDATHHDIEVFDHAGKHLGSMNPINGEMYKPPVPGRDLE